jgi:rod shape-determining protein MreC
MLAIVAGTILLAPGLRTPPFQFIGSPATGLLVRLQSGMGALTGGMTDLWETYIDLINTKKENHRLTQRMLQLEGENLRLRELAIENSRLKLLLDFKHTAPLNLIAARVVGRDPTNWHKTIMIDKGERDGLQVDMGVMTPVGVVGKIIRTTPIGSQVLLLTDRNSSSAALIQRTRDEGIVEGTVDGQARMKYLPILSKVEVGDIVLTSGLAGTYPKGLLIGTVSTVQDPTDQLFQVVQIKPATDFTRLEEVLIIGKP